MGEKVRAEGAGKWFTEYVNRDELRLLRVNVDNEETRVASGLPKDKFVKASAFGFGESDEVKVEIKFPQDKDYAAQVSKGGYGNAIVENGGDKHSHFSLKAKTTSLPS